jgi:hypothetical protein
MRLPRGDDIKGGEHLGVGAREIEMNIAIFHGAGEIDADRHFRNRVVFQIVGER